MTAEKRKRSVNFSTEEKMRFLRILRKKGLVIITKVTSHDLQTNRLKENAWAEVTNELNASGNILRTKDNLKKLWQKMKTEAKAYQTNGASGGPSRMDDPVLEAVADLTGYGSSVEGSTCSGVESVYDCEPQIVNINIKEEKSNLKRHWPTLCDDEHSNKSAKVSSSSSNNDFESERLKCEKEKSALIELQKQHMTEEHALKIKHGGLKTKILEAVLKKVQEEKPVDSELLKIVSNM